jgi:adenosine deaminase
MLQWRRIPSIGFAAAGVRVSINTDDPSLLGTNLPREYEIARATYGWTEDVLRDLARTSIEASFAGRDIKEKMREGEACAAT